MSFLPGECEYARRYFHADLVLPQNALAKGEAPGLEIGTTDNMKVDATLAIDLTGLWWMDGNPLPEYLVSWAGSSAYAPFPSRMTTFNNMAGRWSWSASWITYLIKSYYAFGTVPDEPMNTLWYNSSYGSITPISEEIFEGDFHIYYVAPDTWDRRPSYTLRRVVFSDGTPHPEFWPKFREFFKEQQPNLMMSTWATDDNCHRKCQTLFSCRFCSLFC